MYAVVKGGAVIGIVEKPRFIKKSEDGLFIEATEGDAQGIALNSVPYNLPGGEMEGLETVDLNEVNGGEYIMAQQGVVDTLLRSALEV